MAALVWISVATAFWHFTIFVPDRFAGGMVGAFMCANLGALLVGVIAEGGSLPPLVEVALFDAALGAVGGLIGLGAAYAWGSRAPDGTRG
jgi:hypothetical protein